MSKKWPKPVWRVLEPDERIKPEHPGGPALKRCHYRSRDEGQVRAKLAKMQEDFPRRTFQLYRGIFPADE